MKRKKMRKTNKMNTEKTVSGICGFLTLAALAGMLWWKAFYIEKFTAEGSHIAAELPHNVLAAEGVSEVPESSMQEERKNGNEEIITLEKEPRIAGTEDFSDAVFLGDSRTEGLYLNTDLTNADFYTERGLMVTTIFTRKIVKKEDGTKITALEALEEKQYGKVFIMFGINELGWAYEEIFIEDYVKLLDEIKRLQPDAVIYVQSNLPVTAAKEEKDDIFKNDRIKLYNDLIKKMAEEQQVIFLDSADSVADEHGILPEAASTDGIHLTKDYYQRWFEYIKLHMFDEIEEDGRQKQEKKAELGEEMKNAGI